MAGGGLLADGKLFYTNAYDGCTYCFDRGPTITSVSAPLTSVPLGSAVTIQGTVTDQSPDSKDTPAISDESMSAWMEYLHMQKPMPTNATGVVVHLEYVGSDGARKDMTHVTSDLMGHYQYTWIPPTEGTYKILATFEGTESYYASSAETALLVGQAPAEPEAPEAVPDSTPYVIGFGVAIIVAIAVVGLLLLRKRP